MSSNNYVLSLMRQTQVPEKQIQEYIQVIKSDLGVELATNLKCGYKVIPYGSAVTGLFTQGSDLDLFICCDQRIGRDKAIELVQKLATAAKERLRAKKPLYGDVVTLCNGRVPVLKFTHLGLNREVNLNFTSHTGVNNSFLIKHLLSLDTRIRPMMVLLKVYFKLKLPPGQLTTFNLYSLIIFALQNNKEPVLPPLSTFLDPNAKTLVEKRWPVQFLLKPFDTKNINTLMELILDFCSFYANFDFAKQIVSPYMGNTAVVTKDNFTTFPAFVCPERKFEFDRVINVQDFFVLNVNLGSNCVAFHEICRMHHENRKKYESITDDKELGAAFFART